MPQKNAAKPISVKTSPIWACSACPTPDGLKSHNSGYELWDNDECSDAHWGFGSLHLRKDNPKGEPTEAGAFFGKIDKWPNRKSHVLVGYARGLIEAKGKKVNVKIGPTDFVRDSAWRLMKIPLGKGPMLDTVNDGHKG
ncbi:MAG: hypothetical protein QF662_03000, partial [Phycisphaerae bacterium]|nr:hypothetical protein [Phycisphaerae bacterium]